MVAQRIAERITAGFVPLVVGSHAYAAWLAPGAAGHVLAESLDGLAPSTTHVVVDEAVHAAFGEDLVDALPVPPRSLHVVGPGEAAKRFGELERILAELVDAGIDRNGVVIGLGGGATTDLAGLAAALVARGVRWVAVPTTLLAMVDAALGGKTAVNLRDVKNPVGVFHHPSAVIVDPSLTRTEPDRGFRSAFSEIVKSALIGDPALFDRLERDPASLVERREGAILDAVLASCRVKAAIVAADPDEQGDRMLLNLGHTVGHALESASRGSLTHGEAVGMGLEAALQIGVQLGVTPAALAQRVVRLLRALGLPPLGELSQDVVGRVHADKKRRGSRVQLVVVHDVGAAVIESVELAWLQSAMRKLGPDASLP